jgi:hypothetical protein
MLFAPVQWPPVPPPNPGAPGGGPLQPCWPPPCVPIDDGIVWIAVIGLAFGFYKMYKENNKWKKLK